MLCLCMASIGAVGLSPDNTLYGHSVDTVASHYEEDRLFGSLEELEAQTIGNLLPNDDDLLSGLTDGLDHIIQGSDGDDMDELDFFSNVGGMDLGDSSRPGDSKRWYSPTSVAFFLCIIFALLSHCNSSLFLAGNLYFYHLVVGTRHSFQELGYRISVSFHVC